jgi:hypothetical protein
MKLAVLGLTMGVQFSYKYKVKYFFRVASLTVIMIGFVTLDTSCYS